MSTSTRTSKRTAKRLATLAALGLAATGTTVAVGAATPASAAWDPCDLGVKVDELAAWDAEGRYNILVWKDSAFGSADLNGVQTQGHTTSEQCNDYSGESAGYHWAVFESGTFTRTGDGGYRNWAFSGVWDRPEDTHVVFHQRF